MVALGASCYDNRGAARWRALHPRRRSWLVLLVIALRRVWTAIVGLGFAAATLAGFFISVEHGLFGFQDSSSAPFAHESLIIEICSIVVLMIAGALCFAASPPSTSAGTTPPARESTDA